jgi:hypothetical protein
MLQVQYTQFIDFSGYMASTYELLLETMRTIPTFSWTLFRKTKLIFIEDNK